MRDELARDPARLDVTVVLVTHDREEAFSLADRIALMRNGEVVQEGTPEDIYFAPRPLGGRVRRRRQLLAGALVNGLVETPSASFPRRTRTARARPRADPPELLELEPDPAGVAEVIGRSSAATTSSTACSSTASSSSRSGRRTSSCRSARGFASAARVPGHRLRLSSVRSPYMRGKGDPYTEARCGWLLRWPRARGCGGGCGGDDDGRRHAHRLLRPRGGARRPLFERFEEETGHRRRRSATATAPSSRRRSPRRATTRPADVFFAQDAGALGAVERRSSPSCRTSCSTGSTERFRDAEGRWVGVSGRARVIAYNTDELAEDEVPDTVADVTDPKWKGKIGIAPPNASFQAFVTRDAPRPRRRAHAASGSRP